MDYDFQTSPSNFPKMDYLKSKHVPSIHHINHTYFLKYLKCGWFLKSLFEVAKVSEASYSPPQERGYKGQSPLKLLG